MSGMTVGNPALHLHALTHTGLVRPHNEDAHALLNSIHTAVLADGLGGGRAGEVASAMAVEWLGESLEAQWRPVAPPPSEGAAFEAHLLQRERSLRAAVSQANTAIHRHAQSDESCMGMGTTLVLAHWCGPHLLVGHVGDSRAYILRASRWKMAGRTHHRYELQALTRDHSTAQRDADERLALKRPAPHETHSSEAAPRLTRALGVEPDVVLELHRHTINPGDVVLLCSDGLTDMLSEAQIESIFQESVSPDGAAGDRLAAANRALMQAALEAGGHDNITVVLGLQDTTPLDVACRPP